MKKLGERIKKALEGKGMKQKDLADFLGVAPSSVNLWISHKTLPKIEHLPLIAQFCGFSLDYLLGHETPNTGTLESEENDVPDTPKSLHNTHVKNLDYWKEKYYKLLEENNQLLKNQIDKSKEK